ncbi:MAG: DUF3592 domain-containing protein [Lentisphaeraceae bacterium]|nr:DUF3592 domain-containing protein [Lentisphaeraceae bacterium]
MGKAILSEKGGSIFLTLFGVPFFAAGSLILYFMVLSPFQTLNDSQSWPEVKAHILELKYVDIMQPLTVKYSYIFDGQNYESTSLFLDTDYADLLTQKTIYPELKSAVDGGYNINAFVNPNSPHQAVLYRELKDDDILFMSIFGGVFVIVGLCIMVGGIFMYRSSSKKARYKSQNPDEPWMWDSVWRLGLCKPERKSNLIIGCIFLCFWFGLTGIITLLLYGEFKDGGIVLYVAFGMVFLGLLFVYFYIKAIFKYRKYGQSYLELKTLPGRLGQEFQGDIYAPFFLRPEGDIYFSVDCKHHYSEGTGDSRRSKTDLLYKDEFSVDSDKARSLQEAFIIPVTFQLPDDKPVSSNGIFWTLNVYASTVGIDWSETYKIPVFK